MLKPYIVHWSGSCAIEAHSPQDAVEQVKLYPDVIAACAYSYKAEEQTELHYRVVPRGEIEVAS